MSHNLVQKRGRYPKTKQENNLAQGGWQAQTLSVPSQSQGFSEVDPNYQNQIVDTQQTRLYNSQWTEHQNVMSEEPQHKLDPNGHSMQQDVWNDWGDQGWENWDNNNSQQSQPIQSYHAQQQYQPAQSQQPVQYAVYDQGYHNQQDVQELPVANKQAYEHYPQQVDQNNLSYPASCSTPHYQYNEENSVPPFSPDAHLEGQAAGTRTEVQQTYPSQTTSPASVVAEQIDNQDHLHLQNQQQVFNHASFQQQQQHTFNPQHQQSQGLPQHYNSMNYAQESQNHQHANAQQLTDYSQGYPYAEPDCGTQEENLLNCVEKSSFAVDSGEQLSSHATYDSKPMSTSANPGAGGDEIMREKNDGDLKCGNESAHNDEDVRGSPQNSHEHRDEPISDSWDTLEDNLEGLSIQDQSEEADAIGQGVTNAEVDPQQFQQPQHYQRGDAHFGGEVSQQCVQQEEQQAMNAHFQRNQLEHQQQQEQHRQQQQLEHQQQQEQHQQLEHQQQQQQQQEQQRKLQQQQQQLSSQQQFPPQESRGYHVDQGQQVDCAEERQQLGQQIPHEQQSQQYHQSEEPSQTVGVLPSLSEVLQAKSLKSESIAVENFKAPNLMDASDPEESTALAPPLNEPVSENRASRSSSSSSVGRRDSFVNAFDNSAQERITYMADMVRPASEGAAATDESAAPVSFPLPSNATSKPAPNIDGEDSQSEIPYEPIAAREVIGQRATSERSAPAGLDLKASSVRQSPLGGEGGSLAPPPTLSKAPSESPKHGVNGESYRCGSQDENPRSRRSRRSSSSEDSAAEHDREIMHQKMREREHELPAVSKRDQKWKSSRERLREHDYHSDESEVRKQRRRSNRDSDGERARRKYASDRDYEADEYYDNRRYRRRKDHRRDSDETEYSEYASDRRHRYRSEDDTDALSRSKGRSDENRRQRSKKYLDDSDFDSRRAGRRGNDRKQRDKRHDFYYNRPPSRDSSLNDSIATSQISDSEVSMYGNRRTRHPTFDRHPAMGVHSVYDSRNFQSPAHGFPTMSSSLHPRQPQIIRSQPQREHISDGMIPPELGGHDTLQALRSAYLTDPDYRDIVDEYFASCVADGYDVSQMRSYICGGANLTPSVLAGPTDLNGSLMSPIPFESSIHAEEPGLPEELRKYTRPHAFACFTSLSSLVKLHPSQRNLDGKPPVVEIHDLKLLLEDDPESKALAKFPGPLVRAETHKNQVIHFCNQRVTAIRKNKPYVDHVVDRESYVLLWELLILLLRQNGHVTGTDIAELLLKDAPYVDPASVQKLAEQDMSQVEESDKASSDDSETTVDGTRLNRRALENRRRGLSHDQALSKFRELLLFGHRKEAIEHAIRYELWGHAFCLSSKMDIKFHTYVHSKFYQSFAGNDPLQTVYQLYSGRQPTSVTCVGDVTWGDWRPHLAMILANPSARPEIDARSIITMGDILLSKGCLCAAHFCYLMAQVDFGEFQDKRCKLVLLGSNHLHNFTEFATNEAIVCTEIYEYAQSLSNPGYTLPTLGLYKYLHAKRLVDQGFVQEGLHYCERLAIEIVRNVDAYKPELVHEVYCLASRLRYNDAHYSNVVGNYDDLGHPQWLVNLEQVNDALQRGLPTDRILESRRSSDFENSNIKLEASSYAEPSFLLQNQQQQEQQGHLAMGEQYQQQIPQPAPTQQQYAPRQQEVYDYYSQQVQEQPQRQQPHQPSYYTHPNELATHEELKEEDVSQATVTPDYSNEPYSRSSSNDEIHQNQAAYPTIPEHQNPYAAPSQLAQRQSVTSISSSITSASTNDSVLRPALAQREVPSFQPKATSQAPPKAEAPSPQTSTSAGKKTAPTSRAGQSWLNGIFKSFLPKGPNQMILPDDKDQSIVWDNEKKTWVDKNADPASQESSLAPPPSDHSLGAAPAPPIPFMSPQQPSLQDAQPAVAAPSDSGDRLKATATPPSGTNRFQRITNKPRYVDVFKQNNQTAPAAQQMAPILPEGNVSQFMMPSAQPQFFVPTPPTGAQDEPFDLMSNRVDYDDQQLSQETEKQSGK